MAKYGTVGNKIDFQKGEKRHIKIQKNVHMHNYLISSSANSFYTCKKSPAIDCQAFKDRPVDRDRWLGIPGLRHIDVAKGRNSLRHAKPILGKIHVT